MALIAPLKKYPEMGMKICAILFAILSFYFAKILSQKDAKSLAFIESIIIVSYCVYVLYIIIASIKLFKNYEKNLNSGFNLSIVLTFVLTMILLFFGKHTVQFDDEVCLVGLCSGNPPISDLFLMLGQPFFVPLTLMIVNSTLSSKESGDGAKKRFSSGVILSIPFCIIAAIFSGLTFGILHGDSLL
ncbi:MAG: hypothetical protein CMA91_07010 [Euryarchaeota archaeon]|nr:hypothetical protein [Euryarchaeota archaeon]|tara:strand:+ start:53 stop:613 length:561 start_codon:yes stop_codon:yes gene_type:complete